MVDPLGAARGAANLAGAGTTADVAARIVADARVGRGIDPDRAAAGLTELAGRDPAAAASARAAVEAGMTPVERAQLDVRLASNDNPAATPSPPPPDGAGMILDLGQMALDLTGIVDPTPISDGTNAVISLFRGDFAGAAISAAGIVPVVGDAAKLGKLGKWAENVANAADLARRDPGFAQAARPALEKIRDVLHRADPASLPLPQSAKDRLLAMRTQLDEALAPAARQSVRTFDNAADFNRAANAATPNTTYAYGNFRFTTDGAGRPSVAEGRVSLTPAGRNDPALQAQIGREGRDTDVGFHLVADRFGGQTNRLNVVAGNGRPVGDGVANLNQGAYKRFENTVATLAENPANRVDVRIETRFDAGNATSRPDEFVASYRVNDGRWRTQTFDNK